MCTIESLPVAFKRRKLGGGGESSIVSISILNLVCSRVKGGVFISAKFRYCGVLWCRIFLKSKSYSKLFGPV